jgi:hypothetical protein
VKVKVSAPVQVVHANRRHTLGDTADVPDHLGTEWIRQGWVAASKPAPPRKRRSAAK